ncbi:TPA: HopJ type III effector protein [Pseudomonas aeruginosa]
MPRLEPGMARIRVKDLRLRTFIGIKEEEILNKQDVLINLTILYPAADAVEVNDTLAFIAEHYSYTPSAFDNGSVSNPAGQNEGSCKTLGFAILEGLSLEETLLAFGEHYRAVRDNPEGDDHANIRALQQTGLAGVHFERQPLSRRG